MLKFIGVNIVIVYFGFLIYRICFHYYLFYIKKIKNVLIIGTDARSRVIADEIQGKYALKMNVVGFIKNEDEDYKDDVIQDNKIPVYDTKKQLKDIIEQYSVDVVVISQPNDIILQISRWVRIYKMPDFYEIVTGKYDIDNETITDWYYYYLVHRSDFYDFCKRCYDIIAALIILIVTLPITGFTALRIWLTNKGNPIYTQTRIGIDGKKFKCYKLRTMWANNYVPKDLKKADMQKIKKLMTG